MDFLTEMFVPVIAGICLCVGYTVKSVSLIPNRWIPLINAVLGAALAVWLYHGLVTPAVLLSGMFSGLASTGLYEAFRCVVENCRK